QKLKENSQQAKDNANGNKQVAEFLSNFRSIDTESGQVSQEITPKAEAKVYGYSNVKNEYLSDKYPSFVIQNIYIKYYKD
ncbi:TIGR03546 family protein, partial [Francisella tularensis subsp. holarctica]|nr:TIGR03546 family protein [Francisella tularensis subsp. holarctica]